MNWIETPSGFRRVRSLPLSDRGYRYGMAVFETLRVDRGRLHFLGEHLESLRAACAESGFPEVDLAAAGAFLKGAVAGEQCGVARVHVTAGDGGPADPVRACRVVLDFEAREAERRAEVHLKIAKDIHVANRLKTHCYRKNAAALLAARTAGADEALLFDADGLLISAAMANVFVALEDGTLVTPALARAGIIRGWVLNRRTVREAAVDRDTLRRANEVFLTNSWFGIMPAASLEGVCFASQDAAAGLRRELLAYHDANGA